MPYAAAYTPRQIDAIIEPARQLLDLTSLWHQTSNGPAPFLGPDEFRHLRMPERLPALVIVRDRFVVRPLLPHRPRTGAFLADRGDAGGGTVFHAFRCSTSSVSTRRCTTLCTAPAQGMKHLSASV